LNWLYRTLSNLRGALVPEGDLAEQAVKSGTWATFINIADRGLQLGKLVVLANLLTPADFGLMGIALLTLSVFRRFSTLGLDQALIQRKESDIHSYLNTAWVMQLARGLIIFIIGFIIAPYVAHFFGEPRTTALIRVISLSPLLVGLKNPAVIYFQKNLDFHKEFVLKLSRTLVSVCVAITIAILYESVWALVIGYVIGDLVTVVVSYRIHEYRPWFEFDISLARTLFGYGKWLTASSIIIFLVTEGDDAFVGWYLGAGALGFYQLAYRFSNAPATEVTQVVSSVVFPTYAKLQTEKSKLEDGFLKTIRLITVISFPLSLGILLMTPYFVQIFLGEQWSDAILPMQILAVFGATRSIGSATGPLYQAIGRPDIDTKLAFGHVLLLAPTLYFATIKWDLPGAAAAVVVSHLFVTLVDTYIATTILEMPYRRFIRIMAYPLVASVLMGAVVFGLSRFAVFNSGLPAFVFLISLGGLFYTLLVILIDRYSDYRIRAVFETLVDAFQ